MAPVAGSTKKLKNRGGLWDVGNEFRVRASLGHGRERKCEERAVIPEPHVFATTATNSCSVRGASGGIRPPVSFETELRNVSYSVRKCKYRLGIDVDMQTLLTFTDSVVYLVTVSTRLVRRCCSGAQRGRTEIAAFHC